ncbi:MAG: STAS domain-containing protein [Actinomycetota bacterium]
MDLTIDSQRMGEWTVLQVSGELDLHTSPALRDSVSKILEAGTSKLAIDLEHVGFMDSSSLGILVVALKRIRENGGDLALVGVNGSPLKVLALTGIDRLMPTYGSTADLPAE